MSEKRIISLLPSATEIVCALGLEGQLVGRSHECDYPESVAHLPVCSSAKLSPGSDSASIDREVRAASSAGQSVYDIGKEMIRTLQPDIIITQAQCDVCAVSLADVHAATADTLDSEPEIISLQGNTLDGILKDIRFLAAKLDAQQQGDALLDAMEERIQLVQHKLKFMEHRPAVACIEWLSPLMMAGNWTPELIKIAGGRSVLAEAGRHSVATDFSALLSADPEVLVILPCGFSMERTMREIGVLHQLPGWVDLSAVKNNRVYIADGSHYFNRPGPRIVDSLEILAEILHPKQFNFGFEGTGWIKFNLA